jgi:hypothetical protein
MNDSGKVGAYSAPGQGKTRDGGLDTNADIVFEIATTTYYTRGVSEDNLTVFERENLGKKTPAIADMVGAIGVSPDSLLAWTYEESLSNKSREAAAGPNETYGSASQKDTRRDFSKGHGANPPTQLAPEMCSTGSADQTAKPKTNPDQGASSARVKDVQ